VKARLAVVSAALAVLSTAVVWFTVQPTFQNLTLLLAFFRPEDPALQRLPQVLPWLLAGDALMVGGLLFLVLLLVVGNPLSRAEAAVRQIAGRQGDVDLTGAGPLATRLTLALEGLQRALETERERNRSQLAELTVSHERLQRLQAELVAADRMATVGKLAAGVAHEVGNPLSGILGYLSVLRMRLKGGAQEEVLDRLEHEVQRIDQIVRALLDLGRPSRGKAQPVAARGLVDAAARLLAVGRQFPRVQVVVEVPESLWLLAEPGPLSQVLVNLLLNAAQAMEAAGGAVTVSGGAEGPVGWLRVADQGPGLPPEVRARLFEPFFTTKDPGQGTGLGLAISQHLLAQFEGTLAAENGHAGGAAFTISLRTPPAPAG
jgi:C4-dicarboxylate-specific signal transduction histidine kinase